MRFRSLSIAGRAALAVLLTIGFYGLALTVVALLLFIPYAEMRFAERLHFRLALACLAGAFAILWAILPRRDRFEPPGPRLDASEHPHLFDQVRDLAASTEQKMPVEVYLIPDVNAFVTERGGFMGFGSKRVMGVGLPLLSSLTIPQFRAVLAHEFGHFFGGDTKLGPWIYKTRFAIIRTIMTLGDRSWLRVPFQWYGKLFLRITHAVSRRQEYVADEHSAKTVGSQHLKEGLQAIHALNAAYEAFWRNEYAPLLGARHRPPLVEGFVEYTRAPDIAKAMQETIKQEMANPQTSPYDTHPSLQERIAALAALPPDPNESDSMRAISLLNDVPGLEHKLLTHLFGKDKIQPLKALEWEEVGTAVLFPQWSAGVGQHRIALADVTAASLPDFLHAPDPLVAELKQSKQWIPLTPEQRAGVVLGVLARALSIALVHQGWKLQAPPGKEVSLHKGEAIIRPLSELSALSSGELVAEAWRQRCEELGISEVTLAEPEGEGASTP